jgi:phenylacetate-CoA ligase
MLEHAYRNVPYYKKLFAECEIKPSHIKSLEDMKKLPVTEKTTVESQPDLFFPTDTNGRNSVSYWTSGTAGRRLNIHLDKAARVLEFSFYWRHWSWGGYKLGDPFLQILYDFFGEKRDSRDRVSCFNPITRRLIINGNLLREPKLDAIIKEIKKRKILFFKGAPSTVYTFALMLKERPPDVLSFKAVFTSGGMLLSHQRKTIEQTFGCKVFDSYGNIEGTAAICQCEKGGYHINSDYGILETEDLLPLDMKSGKRNIIGRAIGTNLYNFAMPLIRYSHDDLIEIAPEDERCSCGRTLPLAKSILGRCKDTIMTPDGRYVPKMHDILNRVEGIMLGQIIQEELDKLVIKICKFQEFCVQREKELIKMASSLLGPNVEIELKYIKFEELVNIRRKYRPVVSKIENGIVKKKDIETYKKGGL